MSKSKKIFLALAVVFFLLLSWASYDISSRTTFPGSKSQLKERVKKQLLPSQIPSDSLKLDSISTIHR
jgi:hypothetical protein